MVVMRKLNGCKSEKLMVVMRKLNGRKKRKLNGRNAKS